ncbi:hypothetical protein BJ166DRAFT_316807 [Pestalotiopsis sp. NC0098]|nr:hypothetical protein BJ166DRAFT_316807 [Pestalotiopsis sp. NC0098]
MNLHWSVPLLRFCFFFSSFFQIFGRCLSLGRGTAFARPSWRSTRMIPQKAKVIYGKRYHVKLRCCCVIHRRSSIGIFQFFRVSPFQPFFCEFLSALSTTIDEYQAHGAHVIPRKKNLTKETFVSFIRETWGGKETCHLEGGRRAWRKPHSFFLWPD